MKNLNKLNSWHVTGFADGESCFYISIGKNNKFKTGWKVQAYFQIELHKKDRALLLSIQSFFGGVGRISKHRKEYIQYRVTSLKDLAIIINHFDRYPLLTQKQADFIFLKQAYELIKNKEHLTTQGLLKIVSIRASMNKGLTKVLNTAFPNITPIPRPLVQLPEKIDHYWVAGFVCAEGCFQVKIRKFPTHKLGTRVELVFTVVQHSRDEELLKALIMIFNCGRYTLRKNKLAGDFVVYKTSDVQLKIVPFFDQYSLQGEKSLDFADFKRASDIMKSGGHLTPEGLEQINKIKEGMNTGRSR